MGFTITERMRGDIGGTACRMYEITHDESATAITAASMDLHHVLHVDGHPGLLASTAADTSTLQGYLGLSITAGNAGITFTSANPTGTKWNVTVYGW